jgi:hypothetical protein
MGNPPVVMYTYPRIDEHGNERSRLHRPHWGLETEEVRELCTMDASICLFKLVLVVRFQHDKKSQIRMNPLYIADDANLLRIFVSHTKLTSVRSS